MRVSVLGPLQVGGDVGTTLPPRDRVVLAVLTLRRGLPVKSDTIADALWGETPPDSSVKVIQGCIVRLRKALDSAAIRTTEAGYALRLHHDEVDVAVFEDLVVRARSRLAGRQPDRVRFLADRAQLLWRGDPYADLADWPPARSEIDRLTELRRDIEEISAEAELELGLHEQAVPELVALVRAEPDREHRWALLALAQFRSGRQGEALGTLAMARSHLVSTLGVDPGPELTTLVDAILRHDSGLEGVPARPDTSVDGCPYPGLAPYEAADAETFFGRDADVAECLRRLDERGVVALVGPSGCGKSSVLRAGVAATLLADGRRVVVLTPGPHPGSLLDARTLGPHVVLVVDQGEEAFAAPIEETRSFLLALVEHVHGGGLLAFAVRADRMGELAAHPETARLVEEGLVLLGPLTEDGLRRSIEGPAAQAGLHIEPGLVELLVHDVLGEPGALPLLSHVLRRTWEHREGRTLTVAGYRATGGVRGAVAQSAEALFRGLSAAEQDALRELMTRLVALDDRGDLVRQRVARETVDSDGIRHGVIGRLVDARLVSVDGDAVEISHESLAVAWPRLRSWLDEDVEGIRIMRHLSVAAMNWMALGRSSSELYRGARQARAAEWADRMCPALSAVERDFLEASTELAVSEEHAAVAAARRERLQNRRLRAGLALVGALLVAAVVAGTVAFSASHEAGEQALTADARRLGAEGLRARDVDIRLLLAASGVALHDDVDTRANLLAALDEQPALIRSTRVPRLTMVSVEPGSGQVLVSTISDGLMLLDPDTLAAVGHQEGLSGFAVVTGANGSGSVLTLMPDRIEAESAHRAPLVVLDEGGTPAQDQLGGMPPHRFAFQIQSLSHDGRWLVVELRHRDGDTPAVLGVWDLQAPQTPVTVLPMEGPLSSPVVLDDGGSVAYLTEDALVVRGLPDGEAKHSHGAEDLQTRFLGEALAVSPDGRLLAVAGAGEVVLLDSATWTPRLHIPEVGHVDRMAFSRDGSLLGVAGDVLGVWRLGTEEPVELLRENDAGGHLAFSLDGTTLYSAAFGGNLVVAWDLTGSRGFLRAQPHPAGRVPDYGRLSPDGSQVLHIAPRPQPLFRIRETDSGAVTPLIDAEQGFTSRLDAAWSPDGSLVTMVTGVPRISVWESTTGDLVARTHLPSGEGASMPAFSRDGDRLLVGGTEGRLHVLDSRTLEPVSDPIEVAPSGTPATGRAIENLASGPHGQVLAMLGAGTYLVDSVEGTVEPLDVQARGAGWSPDGDRIFVTMQDGRVGLLDVASRTWISRPGGSQPFAGWIVTYSADGERVVTMADGRVGLFDGRTGEYVGAVTVGTDGAAGFTSGGDEVVIATDGGAVWTWDLDPAAWVAAACRMAGRTLTEQEWRSYLPERDIVPVCAG
jgi:DNA-binding SARP family transcriptional activator/WD40 repeat protein